MNEKQLAALISARLSAGILPKPQHEPTTFAGYGNGKLVCACCSQIIQPEEVQYEEETEAVNGSPSRSLLAHLTCYRLWRAIGSGVAP
jgi:hypothetical protein